MSFELNALSLKYNYSVNKAAHLPILSTGIGAYRVTINLSAFLFHLTSAVYYRVIGQGDKSNENIFRLPIDLQQIVRGVIEIPPILGGLGSLLWDQHLLSPAQRLAFRIEEVYATRIHPHSVDLTNLAEPAEKDLKGASKDFLDFINNKQVMISTNQEKIDAFIKEFHVQNYADAIFKDNQLPFIALAAFLNGNIDRMDIATVLEIYTTKMCYPDCTVHPLLQLNQDGSQEWTKAAREHFLPALEFTRNRGLFTSASKPLEQIQSETIEKLKELPKHKCLFFVYEGMISRQNLDNQIWRLEFLDAPIGSLYADLIDTGLIRTSQQGEEVHLSFDVERIVLNATYDKSNQPFLPKLGKFSPREIKKKVMKKQRLCATFFPQISAGTTVHGSKELPNIIIAHDKGHGQIIQRYPESGVNLLLKLAKEFEEITKYSMSKEIWELIDMVALSVLNKAPLNSSPQEIRGLIDVMSFFAVKKSVAPSFFDAFLMADGSKPGDRFWEQMFFDDQSYPTLLGLVAILSEQESKITTNCGNKLFNKYKQKLITLKQSGFIKETDPAIVKLWKLKKSIAKEPCHPDIPAVQLKFCKITTPGFRKNTIEIQEVL